MITPQELQTTNDILDDDIVMITHDNGDTEKISGADLNKRNQTIIASGTTITGAPLKTGNVVRVMFTVAITGNDTATPLVINYNGSDKTVKVNKNGTLVYFVAANVSSGVYKYLQAYTTLEMVYDGTQFIVIDNPVVISDPLYTIHADGSVGGGAIGDIKPVPYVDVPYGWLECNGQAVSRTTYAALFNLFNTQKYDGTNTLLSRYGTGDGSTTFNLPDYREVALVGAGQNGTEGAALADHDIYTVGQFKDDALKSHNHDILHVPYRYQYSSGSLNAYGGGNFTYYNDGVTGVTQSAGSGSITRGKRKAVKYIIKVL